MEFRMSESLRNVAERTLATASPIPPLVKQRQEREADRPGQRGKDSKESNQSTDPSLQVAPDNTSFSAEARALVPYNKAVTTTQQILTKESESLKQVSSMELPDTPLTRNAVRTNYGSIGQSRQEVPRPGSILNIFA